MYIDRILYPIHTLGPGNRAVIWTKGCSKGCKNCSNPELWHIGKAAKNRSVKELFQIILNISRENRIDGITFTGGDPIEQFDELIEFIKLLKEITNDILVYTGDYFKDLITKKQGYLHLYEKEPRLNRKIGHINFYGNVILGGNDE